VVLGVAALLEGTSWVIAVREFNGKGGASSWWQSIRRPKDPAGFIVLFEDSAALVGLGIAGIGIWASHQYADPCIDGVASIVIGLILAGVAVLLAREAKGLLIGESADRAMISVLWSILDTRPQISAVNHVRTIHTAPDAVFVAISADFIDDLPMGEAESLIEDIQRKMKARVPELTSIYIRPEKQADAVRRPPPA
jgi:divalent metal cation (Fe/Co/Zn/Cd) transporter